MQLGLALLGLDSMINDRRATREEEARKHEVRLLSSSVHPSKIKDALSCIEDQVNANAIE